MADLQCLICDHRIEPETTDDELLKLLGVQSVSATEQLIRHMESHDLTDWIKAFKMADAYIAQLESELAVEQATVAGLRTDLSRAQTAPVLPGPQPAFTPPTGISGDGQLERMFTPAEIARMQKRAEARRRIEAADPNESLIPFISPGSRPEGVVGRKI